MGYVKRQIFCLPWLMHVLGPAYEFAQLGYSFDPFMSVQYYSLASQNGEMEADMALSKWFLCGADGCFAANEDLAYTFADKAARKGLPSAEVSTDSCLILGRALTPVPVCSGLLCVRFQSLQGCRLADFVFVQRAWHRDDQGSRCCDAMVHSGESDRF